MSDLKKCECCGKEFEAYRPNQKYCSKGCKAVTANLKKRENYTPKPKTLKKCECCGNEFEAYHHSQKYCSMGCKVVMANLMKRENYTPKPKTLKKCECCGKEFEAYRPSQKYCSKECHAVVAKLRRNDANCTPKPKPKKLKTCLICGKEFETYRPSQKYCSEECQRIAKNKAARESQKRHYYEAKKKNRKVYVKECPVCEQEFETTDTRKVYCSEECKKLGYLAKLNEYRKMNKPKTKEYICAQCHKPFRSWHLRKFCSEKCRQESQKNPASKYASGTLEENARRADECGLSYGKYMAALRMGKTYEELKIDIREQGVGNREQGTGNRE